MDRQRDPYALLQRWWVKKYSMPPVSVDFLAYTEDELWVEFYEDFYFENKDEILREVGKDGNITFRTGDPDIDMLEARIGKGDISDEEIESIVNTWDSGDKKKNTVVSQNDEDVSFHDAYKG